MLKLLNMWLLTLPEACIIQYPTCAITWTSPTQTLHFGNTDARKDGRSSRSSSACVFTPSSIWALQLHNTNLLWPL